jgi:hypothetical protein
MYCPNPWSQLFTKSLSAVSVTECSKETSKKTTDAPACAQSSWTNFCLAPLSEGHCGIFVPKSEARDSNKERQHANLSQVFRTFFPTCLPFRPWQRKKTNTWFNADSKLWWTHTLSLSLAIAISDSSIEAESEQVVCYFERLLTAYFNN